MSIFEGNLKAQVIGCDRLSPMHHKCPGLGQKLKFLQFGPESLICYVVTDHRHATCRSLPMVLQIRLFVAEISMPCEGLSRFARRSPWGWRIRRAACRTSTQTSRSRVESPFVSEDIRGCSNTTGCTTSQAKTHIEHQGTICIYKILLYIILYIYITINYR